MSRGLSIAVRRVARLVSAGVAVLALVTLDASLGAGATPSAAVGHPAATASVFVKPGVSTAEIARIPVAPGPGVQVTVSGQLTQVQAATGKRYCYDAFYYNVCGLTTGNGVFNTIWVGPAGWTGAIQTASPLSTLSVPAGQPYPAFNPNHVYHLTLNLTGKQLLWAFPHGAVGGERWSGGFTLDFTGTPPSGNPCGNAARAAHKAPPISCAVLVFSHTPTRFGQTLRAAAPPPGDAAVVLSPDLPATATVAGVVASVTGFGPDDTAVLAAARHQCFVDFTRRIVAFLRNHAVTQDPALAAAFTTDFLSVGLRDLSPNSNGQFAVLAACLAFVDAVEAAVSGSQKTARAADASCELAPISLSLGGSGAATRLAAFTVGGTGAVQTSCGQTQGGISLGLAASSSNTSLASVVGPRVGLAVVRSPNDAAGGQLGVTFNTVGSAGPTQTSWTGTWNTSFGSMHLTQSGDRVTGTYAYCDGTATISGTVSGSTLEGTWTQPCNSRNGRIDFVLATNGSSFTGTWGYGSAAPTNPWSGTRA
jgi:hypothetical protein